MNKARATSAAATATPVAGILQRWLPDHAERFVFETIGAEDGYDVFEIESAGGQVLLRGSTGVAQASALNWFLKYACQCQIAWDSVQLRLPDPLPQVARLRKVTPYRHRYYFNYCTFSYSLAFWDWERWEREIDWMALNGINAPLSVTGQEAIWRTVYRQLGLSDDEINAFLVGPAFLPFGWMGCIDGWGGPLPERWCDEHVDLQKKIVDRQRSLGMTPILQGFTGHVPPALARHFPESKVHPLSSWAGFPPTHVLDPMDPLFEQIGRSFVEEQTRQFGSDHLYASDTFIEMTPASNDPAYLAALARAIYQGMAGADAQAVWVLQGWPFYYEKKFWGPDQIRALLGAVPDDGMIILDLFAEQYPYWQQTAAYHGKPWVWCMLHSFGGRPGLYGRMREVAAAPPMALASPQRGKLAGVGISTEAIENNPVQYDLMAEMAWHLEPVDLARWIEDYAARRYGRRSAQAAAAWQLLLGTVYDRAVGIHGLPPSIICARPTLDARRGWRQLDGSLEQTPQIVEAWDLLLACGDAVGEADGYRRDLVDLTATCLTLLAEHTHTHMVEAVQAGSAARFNPAAARFLQIMGDLDALLATRPECLLGRWIAAARQHGATPQEANHLEWNARTLITLWGPRDSMLHDYSCRYWAGLVSSFYQARWQMLIQQVAHDLSAGAVFDADAFEQAVRDFEDSWVHATTPMPVEAAGDTREVARRCYATYKSMLV
jgi:alpha-N-acetylglucosaminidase